MKNFIDMSSKKEYGGYSGGAYLGLLKVQEGQKYI